MKKQESSVEDILSEIQDVVYSISERTGYISRAKKSLKYHQDQYKKTLHIDDRSMIRQYENGINDAKKKIKNLKKEVVRLLNLIS